MNDDLKSVPWGWVFGWVLLSLALIDPQILGIVVGTLFLPVLTYTIAGPLFGHRPAIHICLTFGFTAKLIVDSMYLL